MTTYKQWYDRIDNLLQMQIDLHLTTIGLFLTRRELIELKLIIDTCARLAEEVANERN